MSMLTEPNQTLKREDLGDTFTIVDAKKTLFTTMANKGGQPSNTVFHEPVDAYEAPKIGGRPDGKDVEGSELENPASNRGKVGGRVQWFLRGVGVGKVAATVPDVAGVGKGKEFPKGVAKKTVELKRDVEYTCLSVRDSAEDNGTDGSLTRGVGSWISSSAQADATTATPPGFRPGSAQIISNTATTDHTEANVNTVLQEMFGITGSKDTVHAFCIAAFKAQVTGWMLNGTQSTTSLPLRRFNEDAGSKTLNATVDVYEGDFGTVMLMPTTFMDATNALKQDAYFLHMDRWQIKTQQAPGFDPLANGGGGKKGAVDAIMALMCMNPKAEGKFVRS